MSGPIVEIDLHGMNVEEAIARVADEVLRASSAVYVIRVIHGYNNGTRIKNAILEEYSYGRNPKVIKVRPGSNQGITELYLREL